MGYPSNITLYAILLYYLLHLFLTWMHVWTYIGISKSCVLEKSKWLTIWNGGSIEVCLSLYTASSSWANYIYGLVGVVLSMPLCHKIHRNKIDWHWLMCSKLIIISNIFLWHIFYAPGLLRYELCDKAQLDFQTVTRCRNKILKRASCFFFSHSSHCWTTYFYGIVTLEFG